MKSNIYLAFIFLLTTIATYAQITVDLELRPRAEYRHGFKTLFNEGSDPAVFVSQRSQINTYYNSEKLNLGLSIQDVRVWGDVPTLNTEDNLGSNLHQAWAEIMFNSKMSLKVGRQEINLDDQRILGSVNWVQQARSHDVAILKYNKDKFKMNFAVGFNQEGEALENTTYGIAKNYKAMQYVWLHKDWQNLSGSFLFLNNGKQYIDDDEDKNEIRYSQMLGTHLNYKKNKLNLISNLYYQFGKDVTNNDLSAYLISLEAHYKVSDKIKAGLGVELISGNDDGVVNDGENNAFSPLYGTNHKFNGFMDYFYVGNHANSIGLLDVYLKSKIMLNEKSNLYVGLHNFSSAADFSEKQLGNEIDLVYSYKLQKDVVLKAGYSHLLPSDGMEALKGNTDGETNNLGWVMLVVKPTLFQNNNN